jgi:ribosomal protein L37AE/L43A
MRPQEHVKLSAIAAAATWPWLKKDIWIPFTASILIDADHYLWHAITRRTLSVRAAVRYYRQANPPQLPEMRLLHQPLVLGLLLFLAVRTRSRLLGLILAGLLFHVSLDRYHNARLRSLKHNLNEQADHICPACGKELPELELHTVRRPKNMLEHYSARNYVVLCPDCHREAHQRARARQIEAASSQGAGAPVEGSGAVSFHREVETLDR